MIAEQLEVNNSTPDRQQDYVSGRVDLSYDPDPAISEYFIELDLRMPLDPNNVEGVDFLTVGGRHYDVRFPDDTRCAVHGRRENTPGHMAYLRTYLQNTHDAIFSRNWSRIQEWIDVPSFVDFYIVQEFTRDIDAGGLSMHMTIKGQGDNRRLHKGPVWDFDLSAGNTLPGSNWGTFNTWMENGGYGPTGMWTSVINSWFRELMRTPQFREVVATRFAEVMHEFVPAMNAYIMELATTYEADFNRNFQRWNMLLGRRTWAQPPEIVALRTFMANVEHLIEWYNARLIWLGNYLNP